MFYPPPLLVVRPLTNLFFNVRLPLHIQFPGIRVPWLGKQGQSISLLYNETEQRNVLRGSLSPPGGGGEFFLSHENVGKEIKRRGRGRGRKGREGKGKGKEMRRKKGLIQFSFNMI